MRAVAVTVLLAGWRAAPLTGQDAWVSIPGPGVGLVAGGVTLATGAEGTGTVMGVRADFPLSGVFTLEPGVERVSWQGTGDDEGAGAREIRWMVDFALRGRHDIGRLTPYVGGNVGFLVDFDEERAFDEEFVEAAWGGHAGVGVHVLPRLALQGEVRARWSGGADTRWILYTAGLRWRP
jgi:hypothetical protein